MTARNTRIAEPQTHILALNAAAATEGNDREEEH